MKADVVPHPGIQTAEDIFAHVIRKLAINDNGLVFPEDITSLSGAPGAGKGTHTPLIKQLLGIHSDEIVMSDLLNTQTAKELKSKGILVGNSEATEALFGVLTQKRLTKRLTDGYPRNETQTRIYEILERTHREMNRQFEIKYIVLKIDEATSVARQLARGQKALAHNAEVERTGQGKLEEVRETDLCPAKAAKRYRTYIEETERPLSRLIGEGRGWAIDAMGPLEVVRNRIIETIGSKELVAAVA